MNLFIVGCARNITLNAIAFMHVKLEKKRITFLSRWNDPVKRFALSSSCHAIHVRPVIDKTSTLTFIHLRNDFRKSLFALRGCLFGESKHPEVVDFQIERDFHHILSEP